MPNDEIIHDVDQLGKTIFFFVVLGRLAVGLVSIQNVLLTSVRFPSGEYMVMLTPSTLHVKQVGNAHSRSPTGQSAGQAYR